MHDSLGWVGWGRSVVVCACGFGVGGLGLVSGKTRDFLGLPRGRRQGARPLSLRNLRNRVQNLRNREPQGQDAKRHQDKECIKIGKNREESETVSPQRLQNLRNLRNREPQSQDAKRTPEPGCQTSPKECRNALR